MQLSWTASCCERATVLAEAAGAAMAVTARARVAVPATAAAAAAAADSRRARAARAAAAAVLFLAVIWFSCFRLFLSCLLAISTLPICWLVFQRRIPCLRQGIVPVFPARSLRPGLLGPGSFGPGRSAAPRRLTKTGLAAR